MEDIDDNTQEVTIEVVPETVAEIVYLDEVNDSDDERDSSLNYEIGSVDTSRFPNSNLVLDETAEMVVLIPAYSIHDHEDIQQATVKTEEIEDLDLDEQFDCVHCNYKTNSFEKLQNHSVIHSEVEEYCEICGIHFRQKNSLSRHISEVHTEYTCNICHIVLEGRRKYIAHTRQHNTDYYCPKCNANFLNSEKLMEHLKDHGPVMLYACNKCDEAFPNTTEISMHIRIAHSKRVKVKQTDDIYNPS